MSTATLMFMLMRDRLSYDIGQDTLSLIVQLLEEDTQSQSSYEAKEYDRMIQKVQELYRECHKIGMAKQIDLDSISVSLASFFSFFFFPPFFLILSCSCNFI